MKKKNNGAGEMHDYNAENNYGRSSGYYNPQSDSRNYYNQPENGQDYYGPQGGQGYYDPQQGNGQGYYDPRQGGGQSYHGPQDGGQGYYGPQDSGQGYYDPRQGGGQGYYGPQGGGPGYYGPQGGYGDPDMNDNGKKKGGKRRKKKKNRKAIFILEVIVLLILALGLFAAVQLNRMDRVKLSDILVNTGIGKSGYRNIALFGVDSREGQLESGTNSDTIMVASINEKTGDIKLVSVYRDTYLDNTNGEYRKATECYSGGGAERSVNMLNKNLDLDIKDYVTVDFNAIIAVVDKLGGIELEITEEERGWLNAYLVETSQVTGVPYTTVDAAGYQKLTGIQAMAFCRIRYTEGWDYRRTERQRMVLEQIFAQAQAKGVTGLISLVDEMLPYISTSLSTADMISLASGIAKYSISDTTGFPFNQVAANISAGDCVVPVNLANNVTQLHAFLFGTENYTPSETVQAISNTIINNTGIQ